LKLRQTVTALSSEAFGSPKKSQVVLGKPKHFEHPSKQTEKKMRDISKHQQFLEIIKGGNTLKSTVGIP